MRPVKPEKQKKAQNQSTIQVQEPMYFTPITQNLIQPQQAQSVMVYTGTGQEQVKKNFLSFDYFFISNTWFQMYVVPAPQAPQQPRTMTTYPPPQVMAQVQTQMQQTSSSLQAQQVQQMVAEYPMAPEKPAKPYDLYFKQMVNI